MSLFALGVSQVLGAVALLVCFAMLAGGQRYLPIQCGCVAGASLLQAWLQSDPRLIAAAAATTGLGFVASHGRPPNTQALAPLALGLALVVLAAVTAPTESFVVPLATVLLGLLLTTQPAGSGPGVICLVNGVVLAMTLAPAMPLRGVASLALAAMAATVAPPFTWMRR